MSDYETQPPGDNATELNEIRRTDSGQNRGTTLVVEQPKALTQDSVIVTIQQPSLVC